MRYVTDTLIQPFSYIAALLFVHFATYLRLISFTLSPSLSLFFPFSLSLITVGVALPCAVDGTWEP